MRTSLIRQVGDRTCYSWRARGAAGGRGRHPSAPPTPARRPCRRAERGAPDSGSLSKFLVMIRAHYLRFLSLTESTCGERCACNFNSSFISSVIWVQFIRNYIRNLIGNSIRNYLEHGDIRVAEREPKPEQQQQQPRARREAEGVELETLLLNESKLR